MTVDHYDPLPKSDLPISSLGHVPVLFLAPLSWEDGGVCQHREMPAAPTQHAGVTPIKAPPSPCQHAATAETQEPGQVSKMS